MEFMDANQPVDNMGRTIFDEKGELKVRHDATVVIHPYIKDGDEDSTHELFATAVLIRGEKGNVVVGCMSNMLCIWPADNTPDSLSFGAYGQDVLDFAGVTEDKAELVF